MTTQEDRKYLLFVIRSRRVHGKKYNYTKVEKSRLGRWLPVEIVCPEHGSFTRNEYDHIHLKFGCPMCQEEKAPTNINEKKIEETDVEGLLDQLDTKRPIGW